jgi:hypothetical protein
LAEPVTTKTSLARFTAKNERAAIHELKTRAIDSTDKPANTCGKRRNIELSFIIPILEIRRFYPMLVASALKLLFTKINRGCNLTGSFPFPKNSLGLTATTPDKFSLTMEWALSPSV